MNLEKFQELAPKTLNVLEPKLQLAHMAMGMAGETMSEMMIAHIKNDMPNFLEEATDAKWYIVVLAGIKGITLSSEKLWGHSISTPDVSLIHPYGLIVNLAVGTLVDVIKRESCYGKAKYQGVEVTPEVMEELIYNCLRALDNMIIDNNLDPEVGYDLVIEKLHKVRYKNGYSDEAALNRDLEAEKKVIDGEA